MSTFVQTLTQTDPRQLQGLDRTTPSRRVLSAYLTLLEDTQGSERYARDLLIRTWAAHHHHEPRSGLPGALARAMLTGVLTDHTAQALILAGRNQLGRHLLPVAARLGDAGIGVDYARLYQDLHYFAPTTQTRWQRQLAQALRAAPSPTGA